MEIDWNYQLLPLLFFTFTVVGSPGPNNIMLTASGANYGFRRSIPHMAGIIFGMLLMLLGIAAGLGVVFERWPIVQYSLRALGAGYLFLLAWRIANTRQISDNSTNNSKPLGVIEAATFQFINPKAWMINISAITTFSQEGNNYWYSTLTIALVFTLVMFNTLPLWTSCGVLIRRKLSSPKTFQLVNRILGVLTAASVVMIL